jgi:hypothetical protein
MANNVRKSAKKNEIDLIGHVETLYGKLYATRFSDLTRLRPISF